MNGKQKMEAFKADLLKVFNKHSDLAKFLNITGFCAYKDSSFGIAATFPDVDQFTEQLDQFLYDLIQTEHDEEFQALMKSFFLPISPLMLNDPNFLLDTCEATIEKLVKTIDDSEDMDEVLCNEGVIMRYKYLLFGLYEYATKAHMTAKAKVSLLVDLAKEKIIEDMKKMP